MAIIVFVAINFSAIIFFLAMIPIGIIAFYLYLDWYIDIALKEFFKKKAERLEEEAKNNAVPAFESVEQAERMKYIEFDGNEQPKF